MLTLKKLQSEHGFTLVELMVVLSVTVILFVTFGTFFTNYLTGFFNLQQDGGNFTELASQSERISDVLRGLTDIISASPNDLSAYAYFSPADTYTSVVHYYLNSAGNKVMVDVTQMTANPPSGTIIPSTEKTYTILTNYYQKPGGSLFTYYDASADVLTPPLTNEKIVTEIGVNLGEPASHSVKGQQLNVIVSLRNRKTNL